MRLHFRGTVLPDGEVRDLWVRDGVISDEPIRDADTVHDGGWILPGLVDAHCHVGIKHGGGHEDTAGAVAQAEAERDAGALLLRDAGSPIDARFIDDRDDLPRIIRAGRHIARPRRYIRELGIEVDDERDLPDIVADQARRGDGWVKIVGDWIDRSLGDLAPCGPTRSSNPPSTPPTAKAPASPPTSSAKTPSPASSPRASTASNTAPASPTTPSP